MAARFKVELYVNRNEIDVPAYRKTRLASTVKFGEWAPNPAGGGVKQIKAAMSSELWQEPNTGIIMLRPNTLRADYYDSLTDAQRNLIGTDTTFNTGGWLQMIQERAGKLLSLGHSIPGSALVDTFISAAISAILADSGGKLVPFFWTQLEANQGWSFWCRPGGVWLDKALEFVAVEWGTRYCMRLKTNGVADLHLNTGNGTSPNWKKVAAFNYSQGAVEHGQPFHLACIPFGKDYMAFVFTKNTDPDKLSRPSLSIGTRNVFLYKISDQEVAPPYDPGTTQYIKYPAAPTRILVRKDLYSHEIQFARHLYPTAPVNVFLGVENLNEIYTGGSPSLTPYGYTPKNASGQSKLVLTYTNHKNTGWNVSQDTKLVPVLQLQATGDGLYSSELWSYDIIRGGSTRTPGWTTLDISDKWTKLRWETNTSSDALPATIITDREDAQFPNLLLPQSIPVRISVKGLDDVYIPVFDGYTTHTQSTLEYKYVRRQFECRNMWTRLRETYVDHYDFLDGKSIKVIIEALLYTAGFTPSDIEFTDPNGYLTSLNFDNFRDPNDQKVIDPGKSVGEVLEFIQNYFWTRPLRIIWYNGKWRIYFAPQYTNGSVPALRFTTVTTQTNQTDTARFTSNVFKITGNLEFTVKPLAFNRLIVRTVSGVGSGAEGIQAVVTHNRGGGSWFNKSVYDPTSTWFTGRVQSKVVIPPGAVLAQAENELEIFARTYWDRWSRPPTEVQFLGEWIPGIKLDDFIMITAKDPNSDAMVSMGAYRIDAMNLEASADWTTARDPDHLWHIECRYTATFVGETGSLTFPMFTTTGKLPIRN